MMLPVGGKVIELRLRARCLILVIDMLIVHRVVYVYNHNMFSSIHFKRYVFFFFTILALWFTRFCMLGSVPDGLQADEASFLVNAYSYMTTGLDEDGKRNLWFESYIDPKPTLYALLQIPSIALFGLNSFAARLPSALISVVSILGVYILLKKTINPRLATVVSVLLIFSPWHIILSRGTQEVIVSFAAGIWALVCFVLAAQEKFSRRQLLYAAGAVGLALISAYIYHAAKIVLPLLFILYAWYLAASDKPKRLDKTSICIVFLVGLGIGLLILMSQSQTRFQAVGILSNAGPQLILEEQIRTATTTSPQLVLRAFYNKITAYGISVLQVYLNHFSPDFLIFSGAMPARYLVPFHGLLYYFDIVLLLLGIILAVRDKRTERWLYLMTGWLLVAPLAAALTYQEVPSLIRASFMIVPIYVFIAFAIVQLWEQRKKLPMLVILLMISAIYLWQMSYFSHQLFVQQPRYHPWLRNYADEQLAEYLTANVAATTPVYLSTIRDVYAYLTLQDSELLQLTQQNYPARKQGEFILRNYHFIKSDCYPERVTFQPETVFVVPYGCQLPRGWQEEVLKVIRFRDGADAYKVVTVQPLSEPVLLPLTE